METKIFTYSERGRIFSFFFDMYTLNKPDVVKKVVEAIVPIKNGNVPYIPDINSCEILLEQSFHDFGDPDAILIINNSQQKVCLYFEAKCSPKWDIHTEFDTLKNQIEIKKKIINKEENNKKWPNMSSNLFVQLLYKQILAEKAHEISNNNSICHDFGAMLNKRERGNDQLPIVKRCIGKKSCISRAVNMIRTDPKYTYYVCILPKNNKNTINNIQYKFEEVVELEGMDGLDLNRIGVLFTEDMDKIAKGYKFNTYSFFKDHNSELSNLR